MGDIECGFVALGGSVVVGGVWCRTASESKWEEAKGCPEVAGGFLDRHLCRVISHRGDFAPGGAIGAKKDGKKAETKH